MKKYMKYMKLVEFDTKFNIFYINLIFSEINLDSSTIDVILLTNLIFLTSNLEVPTLNTK
jgi:hypothetical protein